MAGLCKDRISMKNVLVSGGSGSFGTAFIKRLLDIGVERIVCYSRGEHKQEELQRKLRDDRLRCFIGDVRDQARLELAMRGIDTVVHAAALKVVPIAEYNPTECIATNIGGAENVVRAAIRAKVRRVIGLSTDKAANPINLYGASKLAAEKIFVAANNLSTDLCQFSVVRYGNVVGSRGSILPLFRKLAREQNSLPVTDPRMTRFMVTMDQAIDTVLYAESHMQGREIFVPKIPSANIVDLVKAFGRPWHKIGIRPGEKLHETLVTEDECRYLHETSKYYVILPTPRADTLIRTEPYTSDRNSQWLSIEALRETINNECENET